jgi:high-affinity Fe2+/Pb2+ permease
VAMLGWHNIWMNRHGRELDATATLLGKAVLGGSRPLYALTLVVGIAVLREGSEVVLFLYGIAIASGVGAPSILAGGILGLAGGAAVGAVIYFGLLAIPLRRLFMVTSWLILLLAAGMASQGAAFLMQANLLPSLGNDLWDTSSILSENSLLGLLLHVLIGYSAQPSGIQVVFYLATLLGISLLSLWTRPHGASRQRVLAVLGAATVLGALGAGSPANARLEVHYPTVDHREFEIEHFANSTFCTRKGGQSNTTSEYSFGPPCSASVAHWRTSATGSLLRLDPPDGPKPD